jgi:hypothetical protein
MISVIVAVVEEVPQPVAQNGPSMSTQFLELTTL